MTASATSNINIVIKEDGSRVVKRNLDDLGESAKESADGVELLKTAIEGIVGAESVRAITEMVNQYQELHNQLISVTSGQSNLNAVFSKLSDVAATTGTSVAQNVQEFLTLSQATHDLGLSQQQVVNFQTSLNQAMKLSTGTSDQAAAAVDSLAKSLTTGRLEGAGFTRTLQQVPAVGDILAKSLGVTRGALKDMADQGDLSAKQLVDAFAKAAPQLATQFAQLTPSISEAFSDLKDQLMLTVGAFSDSTGAGDLLATSIRSVTEFVKEITPEVVSFGQALTGTLDPSTELSTGMKVFASILIVLETGLEVIVKILYDGIVGGFQAWGNLLGGLGAAIAAWAQGVVDEFTAIVNGVGAIPDAIKKASKGDFTAAGKELADSFQKPWDDAGADFDRSASILGDTFDKLSSQVNDTWSKEMADFTNTGQSAWDKLNKIWDEGARDLQKKQNVGTVSAKQGPNVTTQYSAQEIQATTKALQQLLSQFSAVNGAALQLSQGEELLIKAQKEGIITKAQEGQYLTDLVKHYQDLLDPIGAYSRQLDQQTGLLKFSSDQRQIETTLLQKEVEWRQKGIPVTQAQTTALRAQLQAQQDLQKITAAQDAIQQGSASQQTKNQTDQLIAASNLLKNPSSGVNKNDVTNSLSQQNPDLFANTQEQFDAQTQKYTQLYATIDAMRQKDLISEQTAQAMKVKVWSQSQASQLNVASQFFGDLSALTHSSNTKIAAVGKAAAVAQATINTYTAATAAYASLAAIPIYGPALGAAAAAAAVVAGLANIAKIESAPTGFMTGGSFTVPGATGGPDSQMVAFRATPGERVSVATPAQVRKGDPTGGGSAASAPAPQVNQRIINVLDPGMVGDYLATPEGETALVNVMRRNADTVRSIAKSG